MFHLTLFLFAHLFAFNLVISTEKVDLELDTGILRGFRHRLKKNAGEIAVFFGVPYARPPVGELRFQKPLPPLKWSGILSAEKPKSVCIYHAWPESWGKGKKSYGEDCLYMNIFAPFPLNSTQNGHPILVIIHGGGFEVGSSHDYKNFDDIGAKFVAKGILVVSIDYRLGWIGFGSSGDDEMPGNLGLFDQLAALKFLHKNIRHFGGDPTRITLYGYSAGSASVSMHGVSPHSRDLFSQAIQMSGSPFSAWALNERTVNETRALARELGCPREGNIRRCLGQKGVQQVWTAVGRIGTTRFDDVNFSKWSPRVDCDFLPADYPLLLANATPKPTLMGFVDLESLSWTLFTGANNTLAAFAIAWNEMEEYGRAKFEQFVENLVAKREFYGELAEKVKAEIVDEYLKEDGLEMLSGLNKWQFPHYYLQRYTQVLSDLNFIVPILMELKQKTALNWPIHFYQNVHYNPKEFPNPVKIHQNFHTNDENFLFHEAHFPLNFELSEEDKMMEANLVEMFVNFIKFGNPSTDSIEWLPANKTEPTRHLRIMANPRMQTGLDGDLASRFAFWQKILQKYGQIWDPVRGARPKN